MNKEVEKFKALDMIEGAWRDQILPALNVAYDLEIEHDENFRETPKRVAKALLEKCEGLAFSNNDAKILLGKAFPSEYEGIIKVGPVEAFGLCPHHFESIQMQVWFGYIPSRHQNNTVGLSKIPRMIKILARQPILQEDYTKLLVDVFHDHVYPFGSISIVKAQHGCMLCRGVQTGSDCWVTTSSVTGEFEKCDSIKQEFFRI